MRGVFFRFARRGGRNPALFLAVSGCCGGQDRMCKHFRQATTTWRLNPPPSSIIIIRRYKVVLVRVDDATHPHAQAAARWCMEVLFVTPKGSIRIAEEISPSLACVLEGPGAGLCAAGRGSNKEKRKRACHLGLALSGVLQGVGGLR